MFFLFNKKAKTNKINNFIIPQTNLSVNSRLLILTTNTVDLKSIVLPIHFILKDWDSFLIIYNLQTIRNYAIVKKNLKRIFLKKKYQTFLLPSKNLSHIIKILFLVKMPFHFGISTSRGNLISVTNSFRIVQQLYGLVKLNFYKKKQTTIS